MSDQAFQLTHLIFKYSDFFLNMFYIHSWVNQLSFVFRGFHCSIRFAPL